MFRSYLRKPVIELHNPTNIIPPDYPNELDLGRKNKRFLTMLHVIVNLLRCYIQNCFYFGRISAKNYGQNIMEHTRFIGLQLIYAGVDEL